MTNAVIIGISLGCIYGLVATGFAVIYRTTGVLNFAQGGFVMVSGMTSALVLGRTGSPGWGIAAGLGVALLTGAALALTVIFPLWARKASEFIVILATLLFLVALENVFLNLMGSDPQSLPPLSDGVVRIGGVRLEAQTLYILVITLVLGLTILAFLNHTRLGTAMRACSVDRDVSRMLGISPVRIAFFAVLLAALIGGIGGILIAPIQFTAFNVGHAYNINGFLAAVLGGLGDIRGALIAGIIVGLFESLIAIYVSTTYLQVIVVMALLLVLLLRPQGLFAEYGH